MARNFSRYSLFKWLLLTIMQWKKDTFSRDKNFAYVYGNNEIISCSGMCPHYNKHAEVHALQLETGNAEKHVKS